MAHDREVGGIRCTDVLSLLSDYVDQELDRPTVDRIDAHLRGCDWCERFGGEFSQTITELREHLHDSPPQVLTAAERLKRHLEQQLKDH